MGELAPSTRTDGSVVAQIVPWNYPILMLAWKVGPALAAGCSIVFKAAEQTPLSTLLFAELVKAAGYPAGVFNLVTGVGRITGEAMARHPDIDKVLLRLLAPANPRSHSRAQPRRGAASPSRPPSPTSRA